MFELEFYFAEASDVVWADEVCKVDYIGDFVFGRAGSRELRKGDRGEEMWCREVEEDHC